MQKLIKPFPKITIVFLCTASLAVICGSASCSMDYSEAQVSEEIPESIPDARFTDFSHTVVRDGSVRLYISAEKAESFIKKKETRTYNVTFLQYDKDNKVVTEGVADKAIINTETENAEISGNIVMYSHNQEAKITCKYLYWNQEENTLTAKKEDTVYLHKDNGSVIQGTGFTADFQLQKVRFEGSVEGTYIVDDKEEDEKTTDKTESKNE